MYLSVVDLQGVELIGVFGEVGGAPVVARLLFVDTQEVVQRRVFVVDLVQLVASDGSAHSAPRAEHPVSAHTGTTADVRHGRKSIVTIR